jgi:hypothetical protein
LKERAARYDEAMYMNYLEEKQSSSSKFFTLGGNIRAKLENIFKNVIVKIYVKDTYITPNCYIYILY